MQYYLTGIDTRTWQRLRASGALPDGRANMGVVVVNSFVFVYGGSRGIVYLNDLHMLNLGMLCLCKHCTLESHVCVTDDMMWYRLDTDDTFPRPMACSAVCALGTRMFLVGGKDNQQTYNYVYALQTGMSALLCA